MSELQSTVLDRFLDPFADCLTPEVAQRVVDLRLAPEYQAHIDELARKANQGNISPAEQSEYEEIVEAIDLMGIIQAKARRTLAKHSS